MKFTTYGTQDKNKVTEINIENLDQSLSVSEVRVQQLNIESPGDSINTPII